MWLPEGELKGLVEFVEGVGISKALLQALLLRVAKGDNAAASVKSIEMLLGMDLSTDLTIGTSIENASAIAELASRFLNDTDLSQVLGDIFTSIDESKASGDVVARQHELSGVRKVDAPDLPVFITQSGNDGFSVSAGDGSDSSGDLGAAAATLENGVD